MVKWIDLCIVTNQPGLSNFIKKNILIYFFFLSHSKPCAQKKLTLLQEVLDYEKTPALILTASLFMAEKKKKCQ